MGTCTLKTIISIDDTVSNSVVILTRTEVFTLGKVVAGTEALNVTRNLALTWETTDLFEPLC